MKEIWKDIYEYEGLYQVSNYGNVRKISPFARCTNCSVDNPYLLKPHKSTTGYLHVQLVKNGIPKTINIHRLVAIAFVDNPQNKKEINHIDADRSNNVFTNLEWVTHSENMTHSVKLGNIRPDIMRSKKKPQQYTILQYTIEGQFIREWKRTRDIVLTLNIHYGSLRACLCGRQLSSAGYRWIKHFHNEIIADDIGPIYINRFGNPSRRKRRSDSNASKIAQYNKQNKLIRIWNSYLEIIEDNEFGKNSLANIYKCMNGKRKSAYGFIWKYM